MSVPKYVFIVGAPKCGTSSLTTWLAASARFSVTRDKEPSYFCADGTEFVLGEPGDRTVSRETSTEEAYLESFSDVPDAEWWVDGSTDYLSSDGAETRIAAFCRDTECRIICVLRDPIDRAFSEYQHTLRDGLETRSFTDALSVEDTRRADNWQSLFFHVRRSRYAGDIARFRAAFGERFLITGFAEVTTGPGLARIAAFLDIDPTDMPALGRENASAKGPPTSLPRRMLRAVRRRLSTVETPALQRAALSLGLIRYSERAITRDEQAACFDRLQDDIRACVADPAIPTEEWTTCHRMLKAAAG